jgi:hypothetical protein
MFDWVCPVRIDAPRLFEYEKSCGLFMIEDHRTLSGAPEPPFLTCALEIDQSARKATAMVVKHFIIGGLQ